MKTRVSLSLAVLSLLLSGCISKDFVKTGSATLTPLPETAEVKVYLTGAPKKFSEVGLVRVSGGDMKSRLEKAKQIARENGGNAIIPNRVRVITSTEASGSATENVSIDGKDMQINVIKDPSSSIEAQDFIIVFVESEGTDDSASASTKETKDNTKGDGGRSSDDGAARRGSDNTDSGTTGDKGSAEDYSKLPRATLKQLTEKFDELKGKNFQGSLYPKKFYTAPKSLKDSVPAGKRLLMVTTRSGSHQLLLLVPDSLSGEISKKIRSKKILNFVYTPFSVYKGKKRKYPVIDFVDVIKK